MSGLETEFGTRVLAANVDATTPESQALVKELGFRNHGLTIAAEGVVVWKEPDHEVDMKHVREELRRLVDDNS